MTNKNDTINEIERLFTTKGNEEYFGEKVSQFEHAAQACLLAEKQGYDLEIQVAAFLHDIGHLVEADNENQKMGAFGVANHENLAAEWLLEHGFSFKILEIIKNHVAAKRYLTYIDNGYFAQLSEASKQTLAYQGGIMSENEAKNFERNQYFSQIIRMRRWDDAAKNTNLTLPPLPYFLEKCNMLLVDNDKI